MRKAIQNLLMGVISLLEREEPKKPCLCITDEDDVHYSDCKVGLARDKRMRWEEASWVLERIEDLLAEGEPDQSGLHQLRNAIDKRWSLR